MAKKKKRNKKKPFQANHAAELQFQRSLKKVARASGHIVETHVDGAKITEPEEMDRALVDYSRRIEPWARRQTSKMLEKTSKANRKAFTKYSNEMARLLRENLQRDGALDVVRALMDEQVTLIKSIPLEAGARAQRLASEAFFNSKRSDEIAEELKRTTEVTESRAVLIARTEIARSNAAFTETRATAVGAKGYFWRTTMDGAERESHRKMNGLYIRYDEVPTLSDGTRGHAGTFPNCRCWQDVVFDDE